MNYTNRFRILKGGKISLVVSTLLLSTVVMNAQTISTATTSAVTIANGDGLSVSEGASITLTNDTAVQNAGTVTSIINRGTITTSSSGDDAIYIDGSVSGNIENHGNISQTVNNNANDSAIEINQGYVSGSIINNGTITSDADNGIAIWGDDDGDQSDNLGVVLGGIINNGTISTYGEALDIDDDARVENGIVNNGTMTSSNEVAIEIDETTVINGGITNNSGAIIKSTSTDAIEVLGDAILNGGILNYGTIQGDADGIFMEDNGSQINGGITNYGTIKGGDDALDFNDSATFSGDIKNYGTIIGDDKSIDFGSSVVTSGAIYNYEGGKIIGILAASPSGTINFTNSGLLVLKDSVTLGNEKNSGTIDTSELKGNYIQTSTGEMNLAIDSNTTAGTTYSNFDITGDATFSANANISLDIKNSGNNLNNGDVFQDVVTTTGTLTTSSFNITDNSLEWKFTAVNDGNNIDLTATSTGLTTIENASTSNKSVAKILDNVFTSNNYESEVKVAFGSLNSASEIDEAVAKTLPLFTGDIAQMSIGGVKNVNKIVQSRLAGNSGMNSGDNIFSDGYEWFKPFGAWSKQDSKDGFDGYSTKTYGIVFGEDTALNKTDRVGTAFSFSKTDVSGIDHSSTINTLQLVGYGSRALSDTIESNVQLDINYSDISGRRDINIGTLSKTARASYNSLGIHLGTGIGKTYKANKSTSLTASLRGDITYIKDDSYSESGAGSLNLNIDSKNTKDFEMSTDVKLNKELNNNSSVSVHLGVGYDFLNDPTATTGSFEGTPNSKFSVTGMKQDPWSVLAGTTYKIKDYNGVELLANYDVEKKTSYMSQSISFKARWAF
jgi:uncharacterized protein with beta-barrel porin domain